MNTPVSETTGVQNHHASRENFLHLSDLEWQAVQRMARTIGDAVVGAMLLSLSRDEQHASIAQFIQHELDEARGSLASLQQQAAQQADLLMHQGAQQAELLRQQQESAAAATTARTRRAEPLKIEISKYKAAENESALRWFVELDDAIEARRIEDDAMKVTFAVSNLAGRAKAWALGLKLHDPYCFGSLKQFKTRLQQTFEPPRAEFRARAEFLDVKQGKRDVHAYAQHARYLVSCIVANPIDPQTQVTTFIKGLEDGPIKTHLFRVECENLDEAIAVAMEEDFSRKQAYLHSASYRPARRQDSGPEAMDLSYAESEQSRPHVDKRLQKCNRCQKTGHYAYECNAVRPVPRGPVQEGRSIGKRSQWKRAHAVRGRQREGSSKNGQGQ